MLMSAASDFSSGVPLKVIGVLTSDFSVYHDLAAALKARGIPFASLREDEEVPANVGAIITTAAEASVIPHKNVVAYTTPVETIEAAERALVGASAVRRLIIGIDPGEHPGVAVIGDGRVLSTVHASSPEAVRAIVERAISSIAGEQITVRVGHGSPTQRDRILRALLTLDVEVEVVDETRSTPLAYRSNAERDIGAAKAIALARGATVVSAAPPVVRPSTGELRDLQRKSRIASGGLVTISRTLALAVAVGRLTLEEAVDFQMRGARP